MQEADQQAAGSQEARAQQQEKTQAELCNSVVLFSCKEAAL